jgi:hypothetical protein
MVRRLRGGASFEFSEHLAQAGEIVPRNLVKSVRSQNIVEITEHVADIQIPLLHRLIETDIFDRNMFEVGFSFRYRACLCLAYCTHSSGVPNRASSSTNGMMRRRKSAFSSRDRW